MFRKMNVCGFRKEFPVKKMFAKKYEVSSRTAEAVGMYLPIQPNTKKKPIQLMLNNYGKQLFFPDNPHSWVSWEMDHIKNLQDWRPRKQILFPNDDADDNNCIPSGHDAHECFNSPFIRSAQERHDDIKDAMSFCRSNSIELREYLKARRDDSINNMVFDTHYLPTVEIGKPYDVVSLMAWTYADADADNPERKIPLPNFELSNIAEFISATPAVHPVLANYSKSKKHPESQLHSNMSEIGKPFDMFFHSNKIEACLTGFGLKEKGYLVRGSGEKVEAESLRGKNILVCCISVPVLWNSAEVVHLRALPYACSALFSDEYEVVMVAKMRSGWGHDEGTFNHFLSGFPSSWLAVPFSDKLRCDFICSALGLSSDPVCLIVDRNQKVCAHGSIYNTEVIDKVLFFHDIVIPWRKTRPPLDSILDCKPADILSKIVNCRGADDKVLVSGLKEKLVGLYLCVDGSFIWTLNVIYQECKAKDLEFEIVLVYSPYDLTRYVRPELFQDAINGVLRDPRVSATWWVSPINEYVSRKLVRFCEYTCTDQLIIVGPQNKFVERDGRAVITNYGFNAYPFTKESVVEREWDQCRALTLESLLVYGSRNYVVRRIPQWYYGCSLDQVLVSELQGKIVLLYADRLTLTMQDMTLYNKLMKWYIQHKATSAAPDFEVVFVNCGLDDDYSRGKLETMPWLSCPYDRQHSHLVEKKLSMALGYSYLAAFGKDGKLVSLNALKLLDSFGPDDLPSYGNLRNEISKTVEFVCRLDDGY